MVPRTEMASSRTNRSMSDDSHSSQVRGSTSVLEGNSLINGLDIGAVNIGGIRVGANVSD